MFDLINLPSYRYGKKLNLLNTFGYHVAAYRSKAIPYRTDNPTFTFIILQKMFPHLLLTKTEYGVIVKFPECEK